MPKKGSEMPKGHEVQPTLREQVLAEIEAATWDVDEIRRQLSIDGKPLSKRSVHNHIRYNGLPTFRTPNGRRLGYPDQIAAWLRQRMSEPSGSV